MMSHSPLRMFKKYHDKCVLVSGQGPVLDIAKKYPSTFTESCSDHHLQYVIMLFILVIQVKVTFGVVLLNSANACCHKWDKNINFNCFLFFTFAFYICFLFLLHNMWLALCKKWYVWCNGILMELTKFLWSVLTQSNSVGFTNVVSIDMLRESFPLLDMVDHNRRPKLPVYITWCSPLIIYFIWTHCEIYTFL